MREYATIRQVPSKLKSQLSVVSVACAGMNANYGKECYMMRGEGENTEGYDGRVFQ